MKFDISGRKINQLETIRKKTKVVLNSGEELIGIPDCICWLPSESDENIDEEVLKFDVANSSPVFITENEIKSFSLV